MEERNDLTRRRLLRHGAKLAYIAPAVIVAIRAEPAFALSDGGGGYDNKKGKKVRKDRDRRDEGDDDEEEEEDDED